jgi:hypothetical protein
MNAQKPVAPVKPGSMEVIFLYACPFCRREIPLVSPAHPPPGNSAVCPPKITHNPGGPPTLQ